MPRAPHSQGDAGQGGTFDNDQYLEVISGPL